MVQGGRWGTWEELILGGAVLRHGTANWDAVASELRSRTAFPHLFTAQVCKARYVGLQELYSGCYALFEGLRERRVAELKKELAKSEDYIGCLESKLESLRTEKESDCNSFDCETSHTNSISPADGDDGIYSCKNRLSFVSSARNAGDWAPECNITASVSLKDGINIQLHDDFGMEMTRNLQSHFGYEHFRKKRGPRKRRTCRVLKEANIGESESTSASVKIDGEEYFEGNKPAADLAGFLDSISKQKDLWILPYRFENQAPSQPKKLRRARACMEKASVVTQTMEKGGVLESPARKRGTGRPPVGSQRGGRGCRSRKGEKDVELVTCGL